MKVLCLIDHFGSGGAQRQMVELACGLKRRGHAVELFVYYPALDFFKARVSALAIPVHEYDKRTGSSIGVMNKLRSLLRANTYDIVVSFLHWPNIYAELGSLATPATKVVVSERTSHLDDRSHVAAWVRRNLHRLASHIVTNSHSQNEWLQENFKWLRGKVTTIYNGLDVGEFVDSPLALKEPYELRLIAVGRVGEEKNVLRLLGALEILYASEGWIPSVTWVGRRDSSRSGERYCRSVDAWLGSRPHIASRWTWLGERADVLALIARHHALIHPSLYEGLPNVVCEALATGRPVLVSDVCDHARLVTHGERGFLFDPHDPQAIAAAILGLAALKEQDWIDFSRNARRYAQAELGTERMVSAYEALFASLVGSPLRNP